MRDISDKVFICNDESLLFEEAFWSHIESKKNIAIFSNNAQMLRDRADEWCVKILNDTSKNWKYNKSSGIITTEYGVIVLHPLNKHKLAGTALEVHRAFVHYDYEDLSYLKPIVKKILSRCRL